MIMQDYATKLRQKFIKHIDNGPTLQEQVNKRLREANAIGIAKIKHIQADKRWAP